MDEITQSLLEYKVALVTVSLSILFIGERLVPAVIRIGGWRRVIRNSGLWVLNIGLSLALVIPLSEWAVNTALDWRPVGINNGIELALDIILLDFLIYWWHRANHTISILWRFHEVHHLDEFLDVTSSLRFHLGEIILAALFRALVILILNIPLSSILIFEGVVLIAAAFHHSNLNLQSRREMLISKLLVTPSIHWVHHNAVKHNTDSNYGTIFSFWDPMFSSRSKTERTPEIKIGVEAKTELSFLRLLIHPFSTN